MNISEILKLKDPDAVLEELKRDPFPERKTIQENIDYYNNKHPILVEPSRQDYSIKKTIDGVTTTELVKRSKIVLPIPRQIVETGNAMTFGEPIDLILNNSKDKENTDAFEIFSNVWKAADLDSFNNELFERNAVETKSAELLFVGNPAGSKEEKVESIDAMLFSTKSGDEIYPHFDDQRNLDGLTRVYKKRILVGNDFEEIQITEIYTALGVWRQEGEAASLKFMQLPYGILTIVYYDQFYSEWHWIEPIIDKQELIASQFSDVNKRLGNPAIIINGKVKSMPDVGADVKVWTIQPSKSLTGQQTNGSVDLMESKSSNESIKQEQDRLDDAIYKNTWPDFYKLMQEEATGNISIATMTLKFLNAFVKLGKKRPMYITGLKSRIEILKQMLFKITGKRAFIDLDVTVKFNSVLPDNVTELIANLTESINAGTVSQKSGVYLDPHNKGNESTVLEEVEQESRLQAGQVDI